MSTTDASGARCTTPPAQPRSRRARVRRPAPLALCGLLLLAPPTSAAATPSPRPLAEASFPAGTTLTIRFLRALTSGSVQAGTPLVVQTLGALTRDGCVMVPPFARIAGRVLVSRRGGDFGRSGVLTLRFDSIAAGPDAWLPLDGVLDSLEYGGTRRISAGRIRGGHGGGVGSLLRTGALFGLGALTEVGEVPVTLLAGWRLLHDGPDVRILPGEVARLRLREPFRLPRGNACVRLPQAPERARLRALPAFFPRTTSRRHGGHPGDPINLVFEGSGRDLRAAFDRAGWTPAQAPGLRSLARGIGAALIARPAAGAPVSTQYFEGHRQRMAYELAGPNARIRHHLRIWPLAGAEDTWVAAANEDVGLLVNLLHWRATHRISPRVDRERNLIVRELEATGCARLIDYLDPPDAVTSGRNASGQRFRTDGRIATLRLNACPPARPPSPLPAIMPPALAAAGDSALAPTGDPLAPRASLQ